MRPRGVCPVCVTAVRARWIAADLHVVDHHTARPLRLVGGDQLCRGSGRLVTRAPVPRPISYEETQRLMRDLIDLAA